MAALEAPEDTEADPADITADPDLEAVCTIDLPWAEGCTTVPLWAAACITDPLVTEAAADACFR